MSDEASRSLARRPAVPPCAVEVSMNREPEDAAAEFAASKDWYVDHVGGVAYVPLDELARLIEGSDPASPKPRETLHGERLAAAVWAELEAGAELPWIDVPEADAHRAEVVAWVEKVAARYAGLPATPPAGSTIPDRPRQSHYSDASDGWGGDR